MILKEPDSVSMKTEANENAGVRRRLRRFRPVPTGELRPGASSDLQGQDKRHSERAEA